MKNLNQKHPIFLALLSLLAALVMQAAIHALVPGGAEFQFPLVLGLAALLYAFFLTIFVLPDCKFLAPLERRGVTLWDSDFLGRPAAKAVFLAIFVVLLFLQVNNSSIEQYAMVIPNNIASLDYISLGTSRSIRSDEFLCSTPLFFNDSYGGVAALWADCTTPFQVAANVVSMFNPYHWGYLYFPTSMGFSWTFLIHAASYLYFFYRLFYRATAHRNFSFLFSVLVLLAPGLQWWWSAAMRYHCYAGIIVFFMDYFEASTWRKKVFCAWGILSCASTLLVSPYPAWDIPYAYLFLLILVAFILRDKIWKAFLRISRWDVLLIGITVVLMVCCALATLLGPDVAAQMETVYPGQRFDYGGGIPTMYWANGLPSLLLPWRNFEIPGSNASEISTYLHFFPIPYLIYFGCFRRLRHNRLLHCLMIFNLVVMVYMYLGIGELFSTVTLLSYTTPARIAIVWSLSSFMVLLIECYELRRSHSEQGKQFWDLGGWALINIVLLLYFIGVARTLPDLVQFLTIKGFVFMAAGLMIFLNLMYISRAEWAIAILTVLSLISGAVVNPINFGSDIATQTPLSQAIRSIDQENPGHWLALNNIILPKYVYMQGVYCPMQLNWPPQMDMLRAVDEDGTYEEVYNRYAHVTVQLTDAETSFTLDTPDSFTVHLNTDDLGTWGVDYLVFQGDAPQNTDHTTFEQVYSDELDGIQIYRVDYQQ